MASSERWYDVNVLLSRPGNVTGPDFEASDEILPFIQENIRLLVVGAGGLGCELLKDLALSGFRNIDIIDMDTIDISNLNRQFLFRKEDVGKHKATVAAKRIMERVQGVVVNAHVGRIEDKPNEWYQDFHIIALGLDSLEARRYMNAVICSFLEYDEQGQAVPTSIKPIIDGGSEGLKGHARVLLPGVTPCFECTLWLFPPQLRFPLCTIAETPRSPAHCIEYAKLVLWEQERQKADGDFDSDNPEHMMWVYEKARSRAELFGISGVTLQLTQGVVKNIIPAIASTNAIIAAQCALEVLKAATMFSTGMDNYMMYTGNDGVYTHTVKYERDSMCPVCSPGVPLRLARGATVGEALEALVQLPGLRTIGVTEPSVSCGSRNIFLRGALQPMYEENLGKPLAEFVGEDGGIVLVNDKGLPGPVRVRVSFT